MNGMIAVALVYAFGLFLGLAVSLGLVWTAGGSRRRVLRALGYAPLPFALGYLLFEARLGPPKGLANLGEFLYYGFAAGLVPLGQLLWKRSHDPELGEVLVVILACILVAALYLWIPAIPETPYG